ncbi:uncharacterized protein LOC131291314 [Anopheles ziemanni]|uniref:uncharacterized protein LOC131269290 n=1 Tax=Anopheles coustani TaxID=139045 RepID=UPI0026587437|nr:uncharacterized protein LOC131269290 [Anopheles coustani]XP_058176494.1 uncharacterized protein LOC131291314 [Anopheles ziemanni]
MDHIAEVTTGLSYAPAGILFGYLLLQPVAGDALIECLYLETMYWPYIIAIVAMLVTVVITNGLKLNYRKTQFIHLYIDLVACLFSLAAGLVFLLVDDVIPAVYVGAVAIGLTLVPGLSYLHIRSKGRHRAMYMSLCTFWFLSGVASTATVIAHEDERIAAADGAVVEETLHQNVAIALLASSSLVIVLIGLVELLQREAIVDYRKPLDYDTAMAHDSGRLLSGRRRSFGTFAHFGRSLQPGKSAVSSAAAATAWGAGSTEQIVSPAGGWGGCRYRSLWTVYAIVTKLVGFIAFYWVLLDLGMGATVDLLEEEAVWYCVYWLMAAGALLTTLLTLLLSTKLLFLLGSVFYLIALVLAVAFYSADLRPTEYGAVSMVLFACLGIALPLPAINILELAPLNYNEAALALGTALELLAIALLQYFGTIDGTLFGVEESADDVEQEPDKDVIAAHYITAIVLGVVCAVLVLWHMPNTKHKSLPEIESDLGRMRSYFAFSRRALASAAPEPAAAPRSEPLPNGVGGDGVASMGELSEDNQLSARNAARFAGLYTESPGPRDGSYDSRSRSPFNDFGHELPANGLANGHHHHQDDHSFQLHQEALQRQHEANYLNARLLHHQQLQQRGLDSPTGSDQYLRARGVSPLPAVPSHPDAIRPVPLLPVARTGSRAAQHRGEPMALGSLTVKSEPGTVLRPILLTQKSDAPAPPPMPPADYLTKSLPRVKAVRQSRIPPIVPKPEQPEEVIVPGVEYSHNLVPSQFLRQTLQNSQLFR